MAVQPRTIDEYLAALNEDPRAALTKLRRTIRAAAPQAEECISYQLAAFRQNGMLVAFGATANHCAFYLMSSSTIAAHQDELKDYDTSKGTIRFPADQPLPVALVRKLVKARLAENEGRRSKSNRALRRRSPAGTGLVAPAQSRSRRMRNVSAYQQRLLTRARRRLCEHLLPVFEQLWQAGHPISWIALAPAGQAPYQVLVNLSNGPTLRDLRAGYSWPKPVGSGRNLDERAGPLDNYLFCNRCRHSIAWPRGSVD